MASTLRVNARVNARANAATSAPIADAHPDAPVSAAPFDGSVEGKPTRLQDYGTLCKLRLNMMVLITTAVGFYMADAAPMHHWLMMVHALIGTGLTAASSAVLNQWIEVDRDRRMPRTRNRPLPAGRIAPPEALAMGIALGVMGLGYLWVFTNLLTAALGLLTLVTYLAIYTPLKVRSTLNTIVGAIPGAIPPVMGYTAATNGFGRDGMAALALFGILFLWQMPHFLAIATMYRDDYRAGGYVMLPVIDTDLSSTVRQVLTYCAALLLVSVSPSLFGMTGLLYAAVALLLGVGFTMAGGLFAMTRGRKEARTLFFASIAYLPVLLIVMVFDKL